MAAQQEARGARTGHEDALPAPPGDTVLEAATARTTAARAALRPKKAYTWDELAAYVPTTLTDIDYENGPPIAQSRLRLFGRPQTEVRVTLFRDNHAWCPFCQKVWMWLEEKRVPYRVEKVALRCYGQKEMWYTNLVPSGLVPAVKLDDRVIEDSNTIIEHLENAFGALNGVSITDSEVRRYVKLERRMFDAWMNWAFLMDRSKTDGKAKQKVFVQGLQVMERRLAAAAGSDGASQATATTTEGTAGGGPFFLGDQVTVVDLMLAPFLERMNGTLFYYKGFKLRHGGFELIDRWWAAMEQRPPFAASMSDIHTHAHVVPPLFGMMYESGDEEQQRCKRLVDDGPFLKVPDNDLPPAPNFIDVCLARNIKHKNSIMKQNPHRHGNIDEAFRCALTFMVTGHRLVPPTGTNSSLRYIRDRISVPRDMPSHSAQVMRHVLEQTAQLDGLLKGTPIPVKHRKDQEPFAFIKARQENVLAPGGSGQTLL
ncbi:Glutathione S-transferase DHAR2 (Chloride intracellular channel homolog 2) (CLIC homolog 2) (Glutathione-dependent dehydroascorbate reductase 2) (AtDHAR2) (CytDHAR) (GSH-dependent dehydroascorbate reductase 2) [Durusdinium trenchii]|uniref:Glutathione S-transferase n=1 Tax=Durusdinium trenchii TaxID=1381693 RepID=A0ABP0LIZ0_9DINO